MSACERAAAQARVIRQSFFFRDLADAAESAILQGADIELPSRGFVLGPSKKDVARGLHHALPFDDTASLRSSKGIFGSELLKDRVLRFLYLKEERLAIAAQVQADAAESADRPDADSFEGEVLHLITLNEGQSLRRQTDPVELEGASSVEIVSRIGVWIEMENRRRLVGELWLVTSYKVWAIVVLLETALPRFGDDCRD